MNSVAYHMNMACTWAHTPQGHAYWEAIYDYFNNNGLQPPAIPPVLRTDLRADVVVVLRQHWISAFSEFLKIAVEEDSSWAYEISRQWISVLENATSIVEEEL